MALPLVYTLESLRARWRGTLIAVVGIAGSVGVFVAMLALERGFQAALVTSGSRENGLVRRAGATSEMDSALTLDQLRALSDAPEVRRVDGEPLVSPEVVVVAALPLRTGDEANLQLRGVTPAAHAVHDVVRVTAGRAPRPGLPELLVGRQAAAAFVGLELGQTLRLAGRDWTVAGVFDADGSALESEIWCDAGLLLDAYQRPRGIYQSAVARLEAPERLEAFRRRLQADPRLTVQVDRETDYYAKASAMMSQLILGLGSLVAGIMGVGAVFGALNTMYSAVAERGREIATLRALGFGPRPVVACFLLESLAIALGGGLLGSLAVLPLDGLTTATMNFATFSRLAFAFRITPELLLLGVGFALVMGLAGGLPPAIRAARLPVTVALRDL